MNRGFSVYLDLVRFCAACLVYLSHSNQRWLTQEHVLFSGHAHAAVIIFFVLSGYVIAYVTHTKERSWREYMAARLSRIYSVAVPAVLLTVVLDAVGRTLYPAVYGYPFDHFALRIASSLAFLNEVWFVSITSFSNVPYWSVCYEFWYYALFGLVTFAPRRIALALCMALALLLGPKIVLLAPIWILGALLYRWRGAVAFGTGGSLALAAGSAAGMVVFHLAGVGTGLDGWVKEMLGVERYRSLTWSWHFLSDYVFAALVFLHLAGMRNLAARVTHLPTALVKPIRFLASYTFTLYLLHQPLSLFWASVVRGDPAGRGYWMLTTAAVALSVLGIGYLTEHKRHLLTAWIHELLLRVRVHSGPRVEIPGR